MSNQVQDFNQDLLNDIQNLQQTEKELMSILDDSSNTLTPAQQTSLIKNISEITNMRISLYDSLKSMNTYYKDNLTTSQGTLQDQSVAINIVEEELNQMKQNLETLKNEENNKLRLVEINTYYGEKYKEHAKLMKIVILTLIPIIILALLNGYGILPSVVYYILLAIVAAIGGYYFWKVYVSIITRDAMYYSEYSWYFNAADAPGPPSGNTTDPWANDSLGTCIGQACCSSGQTYDASLNICIGDSTLNAPGSTSSSGSASGSDSASSATNSSSCPLTESYVNYQLTKTSQTNRYKSNNLFHSPPKPTNSNSFIYLSKI
jgi:hypothetical protein